VNAKNEAIFGAHAQSDRFDIEAVFRSNYPRIARVIARVVHDPSRSEELAVAVFCRLDREPRVAPEAVNAWLYKTAVRLGLDELRRRIRRQKYERLFSVARPNPTPEELHSTSEERVQVRTVLAAIKTRNAKLLMLRADGLSYQEIGDVLSLNPASVGTFLKRAQEAFRQEYRRRYE
jgi:RNA polymerase sigma-70 factor (ECF subfamily)